ncbi:MAG: outer membrane lipoprotein carrier protein LolA [Treponema sp.]|nr:outer membrane lipoprotein carrier protein LolA [Treponema sp.]
MKASKLSKKSILFCLYLCISLVALFAKEHDFTTICASLSSYYYTTGSFIQKKTMPKIQRTLISRGIFVVSKKDGIVWDTEKPFSSVVVVSPRGLLQKNSIGTVSMGGQNNVSFAHIYTTIASVFNGDTDTLQQAFFVEFESQTNDKSAQWKVVLTPKESSIKSFIDHLEVVGSFTDSATIDTVSLYEVSGGIITYEFINQIHPEQLTDEQKNYFMVS